MKQQKLTISAISLLLAGLTGQSALAAPLSLYEAPLFLTNSSKANVLVILDNSNSMDEAANGSAVGSASPNSKATHSAMAVPAPIPAGPQPSPATNQMSKTMFTPFMTICMASSAPVRPVPSNQPVIAYCVSKAGAPQTRAAK